MYSLLLIALARVNYAEVVRSMISVVDGCRAADAHKQEEKAARLLSIEVHGWTYSEPRLMDFYLGAVRGLLMHGLGCRVGGIAGEPLRKKRWSILSSPFVHKVAFTQFERRRHSRYFKCYGISPSLYSKIVWYIKANAPMDVNLFFKLHTYEMLSDTLK